MFTCSIDFHYVHDFPTVQSASCNLGVKFLSDFSYKINIDYNNSDGYDLTKYSPLSKTLEENMNYNIKHALSYENEYLSINYRIFVFIPVFSTINFI